MADVIDAKSVSVTQISPNATEKTVADFFSFCGKINKLFLKKEEDSTFSAVVQFESESAAKTALLLTSALIIDRPIVVTPYVSPAQSQTASLGNSVPQENITQRDFNRPDEERTKTSVIISLVASGYVLGQDALHKAQEFDDKHHISSQAKNIVDHWKAKAEEFDQTYKISEKASQIKTTVTDQAKKLDDEYKISEKASQSFTTVKTTANSAFEKFQSLPTVTKISEGLTYGKQVVVGKLEEAKQETQKAIEQKQKERGIDTNAVTPHHENGSAQVQTTTTTTSTITETQSTENNTNNNNNNNNNTVTVMQETSTTPEPTVSN